MSNRCRPRTRPADAIIVPDAQLLFNGDFKRSGVDLVLSKDDHELVLHDYFKGEKRAALASPDGAHLTGDIVNALTGHVQYAQADGSRQRRPRYRSCHQAHRHRDRDPQRRLDHPELRATTSKKATSSSPAPIRRSASPSSTAPCSASRRTRGWCSTKWSTTPTGRTIHRCSAWWRAPSPLSPARPPNTAT